MISFHRKTTKSINITKPIQRYLGKNYANYRNSGVDDKLEHIQKIRTSLMENYNRRDNLQDILEMHYEYLRNLSVLETHLPFGKESFLRTNAKDRNVVVEFTWYDSLRPDKKVISYDVRTDKFCVLYNTATYHAKNALFQKRDEGDDKNIKIAISEFLTASSIFAHLMDASKKLNPAQKTMDMTPNALAFNTLMMQAQAQTCFFEKAQANNFSMDIISKLAMAVAKIYHKAQTIFEKDEALLNWVKKGDYDYKRHVLIQKELFLATAWYWQAKNMGSMKEYGKEVTCLRVALDRLKRASKEKGRNVLNQLLSSRDQLLKTVEAQLNTASSDNDTIYHYPVPTKEEFGEIEPKLLAKITRFDVKKLDQNPEENFLAKLVPVEVSQVIKKLKLILRDDLLKLEAQSLENIRKKSLFLEKYSIFLRPNIEDDESGDYISSEIINVIKEVKIKGGVASVDKKIGEVLDLHKYLIGRADKVESSLKAEEKSYSQNASKYLNYWNIRPSSEANAGLLADLKKIRDFLNEAENTNKTMRERIEKLKPFLSFIETQSEAQIRSSLPKMEIALRNSAEVRQLQEKLQIVEGKKRELEKFIKSEIEANDDGDYSREVMAKNLKGGRSSSLIDAVMMEMREDKIRATEEVEESMRKEIYSEIDEIAEKCAEIDSVLSSDKRNKQKAELLEKYRTTLQGFMTFTEANEEGMRFYEELQKQYLDILEAKTKDYLDSREEESNKRVKEIMNNMSHRNDEYFGQGTTFAYNNLQPNVNPNEQSNYPKPAYDGYQMTRMSNPQGNYQPQAMYPYPDAHGHSQPPLNPNRRGYAPEQQPVIPQSNIQGVSSQNPYQDQAGYMGQQTHNPNPMGQGYYNGGANQPVQMGHNDGFRGNENDGPNQSMNPGSQGTIYYDNYQQHHYQQNQTRR